MTAAQVDKVPFLDLSREYEALEPEWFALLGETGRRGSFVLGPHVDAFEREAAAYVGTRHAIGVANGTDALVLSLKALGIGPGDEVITSPFTFFASAEAVDLVGATPVFADLDPVTFCIDPSSVASRISTRTRAILPVHIFGHPCDMDALGALAKRHSLAVVEDCAQAFGARWGDRVAGQVVGSFGDAGAFSFYPTKVLGCYGDGGLITTNSDDLAARIRRIRNHGAIRPFIHVEVGCNSRLDEVQAALLRIKLRAIGEAIAGRQAVAATYRQQLGETSVVTPATPVNGSHSFNLFTIRVVNRDSVREYLTEAGIATSLCYPEGLHLQEVYGRLGYRRGSLPVCEQACTEALSLPAYPGMPQSHTDRVVEVLKSALKRLS